MSLRLTASDELRESQTTAITSTSLNSADSTRFKGGREKPRSRKKTWGIFYTPEPLIHHLTKWAVTTGTDTILEPSFGGCGFLDACANRLQTLGAQSPWEQMAGCDIDQRAFTNLPTRFQGPSQRRFLLKNFLETKPSDYPISKYSVIIGNPPYVSRHNMWQYQLETARAILTKDGVGVSQGASLWAYFIVHSLAFLEKGGRMAWVLPRSLTQADYAKNIVESLRTRFTKIDILCLGTREFVGVGADEFVDILLCEGYRSELGAVCELRIHHLAKIPSQDQRLVPNSGEQGALRSVREQSLSSAENVSLQELKLLLKAVPLDEFADANIGIVTGATDFFVRSKSELSDYDLSVDQCSFLVTRFGLAQGLRIDKADADALVAADEGVLLVDAKNGLNAPYWDRFPVDRIGKIKTFKKRRDWKDPDDGKYPDAFFPPLIQQYPRLVMNTVGANCTNTVHRVYFRDTANILQRWAIVVSLMTTPVQLSCEMVGRHCGSGGLKIEPSDFARIEIPAFTLTHLQNVTKVADQIDVALRMGRVEQAVDIADRWLYEGAGSFVEQIIRTNAARALKRFHAIRIRP